MTYPPPAPTPPPRRRPVVAPLLFAIVAGATLQVGVPMAVGSLLVPGRPVPGPLPTAQRTPSASARPTPLQTTGPVTMTDGLKRGVVLIAGATTDQSVAGTGMVLTSSGDVLTNYHVVRSTKSISVTIASTGKKYDAKLVGRDATKDVALLRLQGAQGLDTVKLDTDPVAIGDVVIAAGNANGQGFVSANRGNILTMDQVIQVKGPTENDPAELLSGLIESNAPGWPGDSGGPLFDAQTEVLGMTTAGSSQKQEERRVYAIPIAAAMAVVERIRNGDESGTIVIGPKAYLGVVVTEESGGLKVQSVEPGTPAAKAGLKNGVTITRLGDQNITTRAELSTALDGHEPGTTTTIAWRTAAGQDRTADITLGASTVN